MRKNYLSILLTFFVVFIQFTLVSQSKKKVNNHLISQHDSLVKVIHDYDLKVDSLTLLCSNANQSLLSSFNNFKSNEAKESFSNFKKFYETIEAANEGFSEKTSLYIEELNKRYPLFNEKEFIDYVDQVYALTTSTKNQSDLITTRKFNLTKLRPNLTLAVKTGKTQEWNELIFSQNQSLKYYIELQDNYLKNQSALAGYLKDETQENIDFYHEFTPLMNQTKIELENLTILYSNWSEEYKKKQAERERLEALYWKKNKGKTIEFTPPVIMDEEINPIQMESQQGFDEEIPEQKIVRIEPKQEPIVEIKTEKRQEEEIYTIVNESAEFPGGNETLKKYLKENLLYPEFAREIALEGKVYVKFIISKNGDISNVTVLRGIPDCKECDKEAIRLIKSMPKWKPAKVNLKEVHSYNTLPVVFKIE